MLILRHKDTDFLSNSQGKAGKSASALGISEGEDAETDIGGLEELLGAGENGGACGHDIVDDEQVLAPDGLRVDEFEDVLNVLIALPTAFARLAALKHLAADNLLADGQARDLTDTSGDLLTLVVAALAEAFPGQRNRHNSIDSIEESSGLQFLGHQSAHDLANLWVVLVFQVVDDIGALGMGFVIEEGGGFLDRYLPPEETGHLVVISIAMEVGSRQVEVALRTDDLFRHRQTTTTDHTETWGNQIE